MKFNLDSSEFDVKLVAKAFPDVTEIETQRSKKITNSYVELLSKHGGVYQMLDENFVVAKLEKFAQSRPHIANVVKEKKDDVMQVAKQMFKHLSDQLGDNRKYAIHSPLISHLTFPHEGRTFAECGELNDNEKIPAFITFIGQFIDHDLTLNPMNLFDIQGNVNNDASAIIDLDSVYNRNSMVSHTIPGSGDQSSDDPNYEIFNTDGTFKLNKLAPNAYDLIRDQTMGEHKKQPFIYDLRNDENKIILQIHILIVRLHNMLVPTFPNQPDPNNNTSVKNFIAEVRKEVSRTWQSFIIDEYLPTVVSAEPLNWVLGEIVKPDWGNMKHKPEPDGTLKMPHEFSIGFRMGHSQLRDKYHLHPNFAAIPLFDNRSAQPNDLRGTQSLDLQHIIDWPFFSSPVMLSNKIDSKVTCVVFDLPESTIPDMVKEVGNLPQRNLIRSSKVELTAAEDLIELYGLQAQQLTPAQIESDSEKRKLFQLDEQGNYDSGNLFRTPLWYYILKEAEHINSGGQLGPLGGRIIAEVIAGGIYGNPCSFVNDPNWIPKIPKAGGAPRTNSSEDRKVRFADIVNFITE